MATTKTNHHRRRTAFDRLCETWMNWRHEIGAEEALVKLETEYSEWSGIGELRQWTADFLRLEAQIKLDEEDARRGFDWYMEEIRRRNAL